MLQRSLRVLQLGLYPTNAEINAWPLLEETKSPMKFLKPSPKMLYNRGGEMTSNMEFVPLTVKLLLRCSTPKSLKVYVWAVC